MTDRREPFLVKCQQIEPKKKVSEKVVIDFKGLVPPVVMFNKLSCIYLESVKGSVVFWIFKMVFY